MTCPQCGAQLPAGFRFCGNCGLPLDAPPARPAPETPAPGRAPLLAGERREVAVLFADMSGFTQMCEQLDPEDVHAVMNECFAGLGQAIREEGGYVDKYIGDNVMALFGAPVAHEDDPVRACRAALAMQSFLSGFALEGERRTGVRMRMRIGIHYGLVLAGGVGSDVRMDYSVMGDTVNVAARLEAATPPGEILVSREVVRRAGRRFEFGEVQRLSVKGKQQPVEACRLLGERPERDISDDEVLSAPLVGRDAELGELVSRWRERSSWIEVRADIGVGKTRLVKEAAGRVEGARLLLVVGTPEGSRPFGLARRLVFRVLREVLGPAARPATRDEFAAALQLLGEALGPYVDALWHLAAPSHLAVPAPDSDAQTLRRVLEQGVVTLLGCLARHRPGVALFLDAYELVDEASAALLASMGAGGAGGAGAADRPMPVLVASRDEGHETPRSEGALRLARLDPVAAGELLDRLVRGATLPEHLRQGILERAAGVPLYIEEIVRALIDQGVLRLRDDDSGFAYTRREAAVGLPGSIRGAMVSRLDRLPRAEGDLLRECVVQGVEFDEAVALLVRQGRGPPGLAIQDLLGGLERRGLVTRLSVNRWRFVQPLMQEACYETLSLRDRRTLHAETARALSELAGGAGAAAPELLAYHYERAELWGAAAEAHVRAGDREAALYLNGEALSRYAAALRALERLPALAEGDGRVAARAHDGAAQVHLRVGAYALAESHARRMRSVAPGPEARAEADRLLAAAWIQTGRHEEGERLLREVTVAPWEKPVLLPISRALYDLAGLYHRRGRLGEALDRLAECRATSAPPDAGGTIRLDMLEGHIAHTQGRFADAVGLYTRAYRDAERAGILSERARAANQLGTAARDVGGYDEAQRRFAEALAIWTRTGDVEGIAGAENNLGNLAMSGGDLLAARDRHERALARWEEIGNVRGAALTRANLAILAMEQEDAAGALGQAESALRAALASGDVLLAGLARVVLGDARLESGDPGGARTEFARVLEEMEEAHQPLAVAAAWRGLGRVALAEGAVADALPLLSRALDAFERLCRAQEAVRTAIYRAEALLRLGEHGQARAELQQARARLVPMRATRDLARVDRLLGEAGSPEVS